MEGDPLFRVPASSYLNYLVTNGVYCCRLYTAAGSSADKENEVERIFQEQFPEREIVFIDAMPQKLAGGRNSLLDTTATGTNKY
jgi:agmatine deiminase